MADPLSVAASVIAVIQISGKVLSLCYQYFSGTKDAPKDIHSIISEVGSLKSILEDLNSLDNGSDIPTGSRGSALFTSLNAEDGPLKTCEAALQDILAHIDPPIESHNLSKVLLWPLKAKEVHKLLGVVQKQKTSLILALATNGTLAVSRIERSLEENTMMTAKTKELLGENSQTTVQLREFAQANEERNKRDKIIGWLQSTDPSTNHNTAWARHEPRTGDWLLNAPEFSRWKQEEKQILWLFGIPGSGKTVLASTVIRHVKDLCYPGSDIFCAYYYFDFSDPYKQTLTSMLRSVLSQLLCQQGALSDQFRALYSAHQDGTQAPSESDLRVALSSVLETTRVYIILDALDECCQRNVVLDFISSLNRQQTAKVNIMAVSRKEYDIELVLNDISHFKVCVESALVDVDIRLHVQGQLKTDSKLKRLPEDVKKEIETVLVDKACGMFRLVACQLELIRDCPNLGLLRQQLQTLPRTLHQMYERILLKIPQNLQRQAKAALAWLIRTIRPMTLGEVADAAAVDVQIKLVAEDRLFDDHYILDICSSLVSLSETGSRGELMTEYLNPTDSLKALRFAHYTVKEYLLSQEIKEGPAKFFAISGKDLFEDLIETCSIYLDFLRSTGKIPMYGGERFHFAAYAVNDWLQGYFHRPDDPNQTIKKAEEDVLLLLFVIERFETNNRTYEDIVELYESFESYRNISCRLEKSQIETEFSILFGKILRYPCWPYL